jgi:hypothetical protein
MFSRFGILLLLAAFFSLPSAAFADECKSSGLRSSTAELLDFGCNLNKMSGECRSFFYENPDLLEFAENCENPNDHRYEVTKRYDACKDAGIEAWTDIWVQLNKAGRAIEACNEKIECKQRVAFEAYFVCRNPDGSNQFPCVDPAQLADVNVSDLLRKRDQVRELAKRDVNYRNDILSHGAILPEEEGPPLESLVQASLAELGVRRQCFNSVGYWRMGCYALGTVVDPTLLAGGAALGAIKGMKWASAALRVKNLTRATELFAQGARQAGLKAIERAWGKALASEDLKAIEAAHSVGVGELGVDGTTARLGNYTKAQLLRKYKILRGRFSREQIHDLLRSGAAGLAANESKADEVLEALTAVESDTQHLADGIAAQSSKLSNFKDYQTYQAQVDALKKKQEEILANWDPSSLESTQKAQSDLASLKYKLDKAKAEAELWKKRQSNTEWAPVRDDRRVIAPDRVYNIKTDRGEDIKVVFGDKVTSDVMWDTGNSLRSEAGDAFVEAVGRGYTRGGSSSGIETMSLSGRKIVKLRIVGHGVGAYRVYGIEQNGVIYFLTWEQESSHDSQYLNRVYENTIRAFDAYKKSHKI